MQERPVPPDEYVNFAHEQKERLDRVVDLLLAIAFMGASVASFGKYQQLVRELQALEKVAATFAIQHLPTLSDAERKVFAAALVMLLRKNFAAKILFLAGQFRLGIVPASLRLDARVTRTSQLTNELRDKLAESLRKGMINVISKDGRFIRYDPAYFLALNVHSEVAKATKESAITRAAESGFDLVQVSPQPSTIGDYCDLYRGRVFSVSGNNPDFPPLSDCPNQGAPFHPWCQHTLAPIAPDSPAAAAAKALPPIPQEFITLARSGGTPADFMKIWRSHNSSKGTP